MPRFDVRPSTQEPHAAADSVPCYPAERPASTLGLVVVNMAHTLQVKQCDIICWSTQCERAHPISLLPCLPRNQGLIGLRHIHGHCDSSQNGWALVPSSRQTVAQTATPRRHLRSIFIEKRPVC